MYIAASNVMYMLHVIDWRQANYNCHVWRHRNVVRFLPDTCFCAMENKKKLEMCIAAYGLERWYGKTQGAPCI